MKQADINELIEGAFGNVSYMIHSVGRRGIVERDLDVDDFRDLLSRREFRDLVIGELYEAYFLPQRHEFDWQVIHELVSIATSEQMKEFYAVAIVGGVLGNAATAVLRMLLKRVVSEMRAAKLPKARRDPFSAMEGDVGQIESFFLTHGCARINDVEASIKIDRERLYPLLRLLGFRHYRRTHTCYWCRDGATPPAPSNPSFREKSLRRTMSPKAKT
jgi:hypothetical protein